jgi:DNA polymerase III alpha subunit
MWTKTNTIEDLVEGVILHGPDILNHCLVSDDISKYVSRVDAERLNYPIPPDHIDHTQWFIPDKYKELNIKEYCLDLCNTQKETERVLEEINLYESHGFIPVLQTVKYIVDTLRENNILWGVGRGSSVASYVLFLLGVHKINSIQYDLPLEEFFKGEENG